MGGTSADIAVAVEGRVPLSTENSIGFRLPLQVPMLDIATIGAGGGSIAWLDDAGILRVGPQSAGSRPGPASYGHGGSLPTVTDAHLTLGHVLPDSMSANGLPELSLDRARDALRTKIGTPLGIDLEAAAEAVLEVVNDNMAGQVRLVTVDHGVDVRRFTLVAFGGAGPLHACAIVRKLGMAGAIVPVFPGITSALGCTLCDLRHEFGHTLRRSLNDLDVRELSNVLAFQRGQGEAMLREQGVDLSDATQEVTLTMRYDGQRHAVSLELGAEPDLTLPALKQAFATRYEALYGQSLRQPVVLVSARSSVVAPLERLDLGLCFQALQQHPRNSRSVGRARFSGELGESLRGPAIITQRDSTTTIEPGFAAEVLASGSLWLERIKP
jgi:N-methylhydantoinase A